MAWWIVPEDMATRSLTGSMVGDPLEGVAIEEIPP